MLTRFTGTKVLACWYKNTDTDTRTHVLAASAVASAVSEALVSIAGLLFFGETKCCNSDKKKEKFRKKGAEAVSEALAFIADLLLPL